uniref:C-type lectin domain-containing protein n=1 Tax=Lates calcarifer TaxID=8187 RepID=A0A4W6ED36_LATCA
MGRFITVSLSGNSPLVLCEVRLCGSKEGTINVLIHKMRSLFSTVHTYNSPFVLVEQKMTWADALYYCRERYTDLASILDEEDQDWAVLTAKEAQTVFVWLGLRYTCTLDFWFWVEDHHLEYNNWAPGENTQECDMSAAMMKEKDNLWFRKFDNETFNFICAK